MQHRLAPARLASLLCLALVAPAANAADAQWGVGAGAGTRPVLSVAVQPSQDVAYHVMGHLTEERIVLSADLQRFMTPAFGYGDGWRLAFYAGAGAEGASERRTAEGADGADAERYRLRLPLGAQGVVRDAALAVFAETAATVGPLPATRLGAVVTGGLRAVF